MITARQNGPSILSRTLTIALVPMGVLLLAVPQLAAHSESDRSRLSPPPGFLAPDQHERALNAGLLESRDRIFDPPDPQRLQQEAESFPPPLLDDDPPSQLLPPLSDRHHLWALPPEVTARLPGQHPPGSRRSPLLLAQGVRPPPPNAVDQHRQSSTPATRSHSAPPAPAAPLLSTTGGHSPEPPIDEEARLALQSRMNHILFRDRHYNVLLTQATEDLAQGHHSRALDSLFRIVTAVDDVLIWRQDTLTPQSARREAIAILQTLPPHLRAQYDRLAGTTAQQELDNAINSQSLSTLCQMAERHAPTQAGRLGTIAAAEILADLGRFEESALLWNRLLNDPWHAKELTPSDLDHATFVMQQQGLTTRFTETKHAETRTTPFHRPVWEATNYPSPTAEDLRRLADYQRAMYTVTGTNNSLLLQELMARNRERIEPEAHSLSAVRPIVQGSRLIIRDVDGVTCRDLRTGREIWHYHTASSLTEAISLRTSSVSDASSLLSTLDAWVIDNSLLGTLSTDGHTIYFLDDVTTHQETESASANASNTSLAATQGTSSDQAPHDQLRQPQPAPDRSQNTENRSPVQFVNRVRNRLVAVSLHAELASDHVDVRPTQLASLDIDRLIQSSTPGQPAVHCNPANKTPVVQQLWSTSQEGPRQSTDDSQRPLSLSGHFLLGPPACADGRLFLLSESHRQVYLSILEARTGTVLTMQPLALVDPPIKPGDRRLRIAHTPTVHQGIVYCPLPIGAIAAVDARSGSLCWLTQFTDAASQTANTSWRSERHRRGHASIPVRPIIQGDFVYILPSDSQELWAIHRHTGTLQWNTPSKELLDIVLSPNGVLLTVSSRRVQAFSANLGEPLWSIPIDSLAGTGTIVGDDLLLPTRSRGLLRIDTRTGQTADDHRDLLNLAISQKSIPTLLTRGAPGSTLTTSSSRTVVGSANLLGNVVATPWGVVVASTEGVQLQCFPKVLLEQLSSSESSSGTQTEVLKAELELATGQVTSAIARLRDSVHQEQPLPTLVEVSDSTQTARTLLRRVLLKQARTTLAEIDALASVKDRITRPTGDLNDLQALVSPSHHHLVDEVDRLLQEAAQLADSQQDRVEVELAAMQTMWLRDDPHRAIAASEQLLSHANEGPIPIDPLGIWRVSARASTRASRHDYSPTLISTQDLSALTKSPSLELAFIEQLTAADRAELQAAYDLSTDSLNRRPVHSIGTRPLRHGTSATSPALIDSAMSSRIATSQGERLDRLAQFIASLPVNEHLLLAFARREQGRGNLLAAESLLYRNLQHREKTPENIARPPHVETALLKAELAQHWGRAGLHHEARMLLRSFQLDRQTSVPTSISEGHFAANQSPVRSVHFTASYHAAILEPKTSHTQQSPHDSRTSLGITPLRTAELVIQPAVFNATPLTSYTSPVPFVSIRRTDTAPSTSPTISFSRELRRPAGSSIRLMQLSEPAPEPPSVIGAMTGTTSSSTTTVPSTSLSNLAFVEANTGAILDWVSMPPRAREPSLERQESWPSFVPLVDQSLHGLSIPDRRILWTLHPADAIDRSSRPRVGPYGPGYLIVQTPGGLCNVHPATGEILWERRDIPSDTGLFASESTGIIGDANCCVLFDADMQGYRLFSTLTGEELRQGRLEHSGRNMLRYRTAFGSQLCYLTDAEPHSSLRVWAPATDTLLVDRPLHSPRLLDKTDSQHVSFVDRKLTLCIIHVPTGRFIVEHPLRADDVEQVSSLRTFSDGRNWFVNLVETNHQRAAERTETTLPDVGPTAWNSTGTLLAIERSTGKLAWSRNQLCRTVIRDPSGDLPYIITLFRPSQRPDSPEPSITMELFDRKTGSLCGVMEGLPWKSISSSVTSAETGIATLSWPECEVTIGQQRHLD
ncbi:MAG: PQQ-binding-like beta-propeller repeat protein [Planctomycetaceae bacterium]